MTKVVLNRTIQIRLKKEQYERIKNYSTQRGFNSLSSFLRFVALEQDFALQQKIYETHEKTSQLHAHFFGDKGTTKFKKVQQVKCPT